MPILLNCDLGEHDHEPTMAIEKGIMPYIDQANVACGFHAGNTHTMTETVRLATQFTVQLGAHPSYPDKENFGRHSIACSQEELHEDLIAQINTLQDIALNQGVSLDYVKPHGALYNDMMKDRNIRETIFSAIATYQKGTSPEQPLKLMLQATPQQDAITEEAKKAGVDILFEAFADRAYTDEGLLVSRSQAGALLTTNEALKQTRQLINSGTITSINGKILPLHVDSLCVHGDNPAALALTQNIRSLLDTCKQ